MKNKILKFLPAISWTIASYILLTIPGEDLPEVDFFEMIYFDKWVHIGMFGLLCLLWCLPFLKKEESNHKIFLLVSLLVISYGIIMEFVQKYFTRDRSFDVTDILADIAGSILGLVAVRIFATNLEIRAKNKPL